MVKWQGHRCHKKAFWVAGKWSSLHPSPITDKHCCFPWANPSLKCRNTYHLGSTIEARASELRVPWGRGCPGPEKRQAHAQGSSVPRPSLPLTLCPITHLWGEDKSSPLTVISHRIFFKSNLQKSFQKTIILLNIHKGCNLGHIFSPLEISFFACVKPKDQW